MLKRRLTRNPNTDISRVLSAACYRHLGRPEDARAQWQEALRVNPNYSLEHRRTVLPYKNPSDFELLVDGLRKAGLVTWPPRGANLNVGAFRSSLSSWDNLAVAAGTPVRSWELCATMRLPGSGAIRERLGSLFVVPSTAGSRKASTRSIRNGPKHRCNKGYDHKCAAS